MTLAFVWACIFGYQATGSAQTFGKLFPGGRAQAMAGTQNAAGNDGMSVFFNPALLVQLNSDEFSGSVNAFAVMKTTSKNGLGREDLEVRSDSLLTALSFAGRLEALPHWHFSAGFYTPEAQKAQYSVVMDAQPGKSIEQLLVTAKEEITEVRFALGAATALSPSVEFGFGLHVTRVTQEGTTHVAMILRDFRLPGVREPTRVMIVTGASDSGDSYLIGPSLGLCVNPTETLRIGLSARKDFTVYESYRNWEAASLAASDPSGAPVKPDQAAGDAAYSKPTSAWSSSKTAHRYLRPPVVLGGGLSKSFGSATMIAADFDWKSQAALREDDMLVFQKAALRGSLGAEFKIEGMPSIMMGSYFEQDDSRVKAASGEEPASYIDFVGATFGSALEHRRTRYTLSSVSGWGKGRGRSAGIDGERENLEMRARLFTVALAIQSSL